MPCCSIIGQIFLATPKEQHFFSLHWQRGEQWYADQFAQAESHQCCGEVTPYYLFHPEVPQRIKSQLPAVKLIVLLRDPVERACRSISIVAVWA